MELKSKSRADIEKLLQVGKVDVGNGTLFGVSERRTPKTNGLTLVISTGGSGMSSIKEAMRIADQKLRVDYKNYVKFIVVDSSKGEVDDMKRKSKGVKTLNISSPGAQSRLQHSLRPSFFKKIMPKDYNMQLINEDGASQDRMTGRIKLYDESAGSTNDTLFRNMIQNLFKTEWAAYANLPIDIMILTGISGGNGSGTFIDLAAQAKVACPDPSKVHVYGYIMLPDTAERFASTDAAKRTLHRNGFAALKELESYMSIGFNLNRKETIESTQPANTVTFSPINLPFNYPVLISGDYDDAVSMIGETIVNLIASSEGEFSQEAFYSNLYTMRDRILSRADISDNGILRRGACPEDSHMYCGIGFAHASIPEKIVIPNVVSKVCQKVYVEQNVGIAGAQTATAFCSKNKYLGRADFENAIRSIFALDSEPQLNSESLYRKIFNIIASHSRLKENQWDVSFQEIVNGEVGEYEKGFNIDETARLAVEQVRKALQTEYNGILTNSQKEMEKYGPRAFEYLYHGTGAMDPNGVQEDFSDISIRVLLKTAVGKLTALAGKPGTWPALLPQENIVGRAVEALLKSKANEWKGQATTAAQQSVYSKVAQSMNGLSGIWRVEYQDKIERFIESSLRFADVLETMNEYYKGVGKSLDASDFNEFASTTGERNGVNLCSDAKMYHWVKGNVETKVNSIDVNTVKEALVSDFFAKSADWTSEDPGKARRAFDDVMGRICGVGKYATVNNGLNMGITEYFETLLADIPVGQQPVEVQNVVSLIMQRLLQSSAPSLDIEVGSKNCINQTILVPQSLISGQYGPMIQKALKEVLGETGRVGVSSVVDAIVCYQTSVANALADLKQLNLWEDAYESTKNATMHSVNGEYPSKYTEADKVDTDRIRSIKGADVDPVTSQICGTGLSWMNYPSINVRRYEGEFEQTPATIEGVYRRTKFAEKVKYALLNGIIEEECTDNIYKYWINTIPEDWKNLSLRGYRPRNASDAMAGKELFDYLAKQNPAGNQNYRKQIILTGSEFFDEKGFDFNTIISIEHWTDEQVKKTARGYMMRALRKNTYLFQEMQETLYRYCEVQAELSAIIGPMMEKLRAENFADLFLYGVITSDEDDYEYKVQINERGSNEILVTLGRREKARMGDLEKGLLADELKLAIVYRRYKALVEEGTITESRIKDVKEAILDKLSDKELDQMIDKNVEKLEKEISIYKDVVAGAKDPVDVLMDKYNMSDRDIEEAEAIVTFYEAVQESVKNV